MARRYHPLTLLGWRRHALPKFALLPLVKANMSIRFKFVANNRLLARNMRRPS